MFYSLRMLYAVYLKPTLSYRVCDSWLLLLPTRTGNGSRDADHTGNDVSSPYITFGIKLLKYNIYEKE